MASVAKGKAAATLLVIAIEASRFREGDRRRLGGGGGLVVPVKSISSYQASEHFGAMGIFTGHDVLVAGDWTRQQLDWVPRGTTLLDDLNAMDFSA